ncbi:hypothetical protein Poli38472_013303 [Pythium oligandrum]|uniref:Polycystin cation channel PKD1/PKD2 domain-containing protein n=1 Tax=Pythium oligandrum TaxID=41045 RepID=A0A8K1FDC1_PYTOL|nr:hypothetical protein Poli38472_013303 [Pythium oligandrum]|eukprot:TMW55412.1 hypothetical protein Poli38472_013303 [Pythium oligandrum]
MTMMSSSAKSSMRVTLLQSLRAVLHLGVILALTIRSAHLGNALHPYERALANEWINLLFYVETTETVQEILPDGESDATDVVVILPHFLLESEEEIAASIEDETFSTGFHARASSYPVGMLFTINETRQHLHGAVANYLRLPDVAIGSYVIAGKKHGASKLLPLPEMTVWTSWNEDAVPTKYTISGHNESEWPAPLRLNYTNATDTRAFFDLLDGIELQFMVGMRQKDKETHVDELYQWWVRFTYDLQSQGHLEVSMNFGLKPRHGHKNADELEGGRQQVPPIFFNENTVFDWCLLGLILVYQTVEFVLKWWNSNTAEEILSPRRRGPQPPQVYRQHVWRAFVKEARDFWFWFILALNIATMACIFQAWFHAYRLYLWDTLSLVFATCCAGQWISLVRYLSVNTRFHILGLTLQRGLPRVAQFLIGVLPIFVGYVLFGTIMFGAKVPRFQSAGTTATTLFSVANGDEIHDTFNDVAFAPWVGQIYVYSYLILFSYVVLMVCIAIMEDAFFSAVFPASWPSLHRAETEGHRSGAQAETQRPSTAAMWED